MIYDVKGKIKVRHICDCDFCSVKEEDDLVDTRLWSLTTYQPIKYSISC